MQAVFIDFDDTLVYTNILFDTVKAEFYAFMEDQGLYDDGLPSSLNRADISNIQKADCLARWCFPFALKQTYIDYCQKYGRVFDLEIADMCEKLGDTVYTAPITVKDHAVELLDRLKKKHPLFLITQSEPEVQRFRIFRSGLQKYFDDIYIIKNKSVDFFRDMIQRLGVKTQNSWMIGDSLRFDIFPALEAGLNAIHILSENNWDYDHLEIKADHHCVNSLLDCLNIIK